MVFSFTFSSFSVPAATKPATVLIHSYGPTSRLPLRTNSTDIILAIAVAARTDLVSSLLAQMVTTTTSATPISKCSYLIRKAHHRTHYGLLSKARVVLSCTSWRICAWSAGAVAPTGSHKLWQWRAHQRQAAATPSGNSSSAPPKRPPHWRI